MTENSDDYICRVKRARRPRRGHPAAVPMVRAPTRRRVRSIAAHLCAGSESKSSSPTQHEASEQPEEEPWRDRDPLADPPLGSLEGPTPQLRCWTVAELGTTSADGLAPSEFPAALSRSHPAVEQFRTFGYCAVSDAVHPAALARIVATFKRKQPHARAVYDASITADTAAGEEHRASKTYRQMYDLPREDMGAASLAEACELSTVAVSHLRLRPRRTASSTSLTPHLSQINSSSA